MAYSLLIDSNKGYCTIGGVVITGTLLTSFYGLNFEDIEPSVVNMKRLTNDTRPVYQTNIFGSTVDINGAIVSRDSINRTMPAVVEYKMYSIAASEISLSLGEDLVKKSAINAYLIAAIEFYSKLRLNNDITVDGLNNISTKLTELISRYNSNTCTFEFISNNSVTSNISGIGIIAPNSMSYDYNKFLNNGSLAGAILCQ